MFDANVIKDLLYFETAVFVEARSLQPKGVPRNSPHMGRWPMR